MDAYWIDCGNNFNKRAYLTVIIPKKMELLDLSEEDYRIEMRKLLKQYNEEGMDDRKEVDEVRYCIDEDKFPIEIFKKFVDYLEGEKGMVSFIIEERTDNSGFDMWWQAETYIDLFKNSEIQKEKEKYPKARLTGLGIIFDYDVADHERSFDDMIDDIRKLEQSAIILLRVIGKK